MNKDEIKKALYKQKPIAELIHVKKNGVTYMTSLIPGGFVVFRVPLNEIGDAEWLVEMPSQLLIRYILLDNEEEKETGNSQL